MIISHGLFVYVVMMSLACGFISGMMTGVWWVTKSDDRTRK